MDRLLNREYNIFDLIAAMLVVLFVTVATQAAMMTPAQAACVLTPIGYGPSEPADPPPVDRWGDSINGRSLVSVNNSSTIEYEYRLDAPDADGQPKYTPCTP